MTKLCLRFSASRLPELLEVSFRHDELGVHISSARGAGDKGGGASFGWTKGVQALCLALTRYRLNALSDLEPGWLLVGERGSLARSLDFAFTKEPQWLAEMFGTDARGKGNARRLFIRDNPEGKRPGPNRIKVNKRLLAPSQIDIYLGSSLVKSHQGLRALIAGLSHGEHVVSSRVPCRKQREVPHTHAPLIETSDLDDSPLTRWRARALAEARRVLTETRSFSTRLAVEGLLRLRSHPLGIFPRLRESLNILELSIPATARFNPMPDWVALRRAFTRLGPMSVGISTGGVASMAIFDALVESAQLPIQVCYQFANSQETVDRVRSGSLAEVVDAVNLSVVCAMRAMSDCPRSDFRPFMLMPHNSHAVLKRTTITDSPLPPIGRHLTDASKPEPRGIRLLYSDRSSAALYAPMLSHPKATPTGEGNLVQVLEEPLSLRSAILADPMFVAPLWWPHYDTLAMDGSITSEVLPPTWEFDVTILFLHRRFADDKTIRSHLALALRDTWLRLLSDPQALESVTHKRYNDPEFFRFFSRSIGEFEPPYMSKVSGE